MDYILPSMREMSILGGAKPTLEQKLAIESGEKPILSKNQILVSPNQRLAWAALSNPLARHANVVGGTRCVAGDTVLDGQPKTIAELAAEGRPVRVLTSHGFEMAEAPFLKGYATLWEVKTSSGKKVSVTDDHRFWNGAEWVKTKDLRVGDSIASLGAFQSFLPFPPGSNSERIRQESPANAPHLIHRVLSFLGRCSGYRRQYDEQLPPEATGVQAYHALECDVLQHTRRIRTPRASDKHTDLSGLPFAKGIHQRLWLFLRSTSGGFPCRSSRFVGVSRVFCSAYESFLAQLQTFRLAFSRSTLRMPANVDPQNCGRLSSFYRLLGPLMGRSQGVVAPSVARLRTYLSVLQYLGRGSLSLVRPSQFRCEDPISTHRPLDYPFAGGYVLDTVTSITACAYAPFYTLHVPGSQQYFANGLLHHNSGKTFLIMRAIMARAIKAPETRHAVLRLHGNAARASVALDTLPNVMKICFPGIKLEEKRQDGYFLVPNGSQIWIGGLDDKDRIEKILGTEFSTIFLNEASQIPYSSFLVAMTRLAQVHEKIQQRAYVDLNPVGKTHWTNKLFGLHIDPISNQPLRNPEAYARAFLNPVDNAHNLSKEFLDNLSFMPEKQRKRFFEGVYVDEVEGALWTYGGIDQHRCSIDDIPVAQRQRVVIAVDPSGAKSTDDEKADEIGIIAAAKGMDGKAYILEDGSLRASPREWAMKAISLYHKYQADVMVAEGNYGGALVEATIKAVDESINVKMVTASRGKVVRAEPIAAHHDGGRIKYAGKFPKLEDQLCAFSSDGYKGADSPDHADSMIWAVTELLGATDGGAIIEFYRQLAEEQEARKSGGAS